MANHLMRFQSDQIILSDQEVLATLNFFFPDSGIRQENLTHEMRSFAQAMLIEAVDRSYEMGYIQILFETFMYRPVVDFVKLRSMVEGFLKKAAKHWFQHYTGDLTKLKIYDSVRLTIIRNHRIVIDEFKNGIDFSY